MGLLQRLKQHVLHDDLRRSSTLLVLSQAVNAAGAFLFWMLCARLFPASQIGLATAFISYGALVAAFTHLGLPVTVLRFLPMSKRRGGLFSAAMLLVTVCSLLGGVIALAAIRLLAPRLVFAQHDAGLALLLVLLVAVGALAGLMDSVLTALKKSGYVLGKTAIVTLPRLLSVFTVAGLGLGGLVGLYTLSLLGGVVFAAVLIARRLKHSGLLSPAFGELYPHRAFAAANYFGSMFGILPGTLVPLIVLAKLGPTQAAFFYMPMQLAVFLGIIASSTCQALLAAVAHDDNPAMYRAYVVKAARHLYRLLIPAALCMVLLGWVVLHLYGAAYAAHGYAPLLILCAASLLVGLNWLGDAWLNIQKRGRAYFLMNAVNALAVVAGVYALAGRGLVGVAAGWLLGQTVSAAIYVALFARSQLAILLGVKIS
ncbi:MAG TPA: hypothetical protein VF466_01260 [Candidatus Saccharimonadales bacterium]